MSFNYKQIYDKYYYYYRLLYLHIYFSSTAVGFKNFNIFSLATLIQSLLLSALDIQLVANISATE